ncbi:hypothetical protein FHR81_004655 [Actinoalloteichus hoggarensis]|uniref:Uncharacterized protein n=1 Tax=Actinoalloteichus hoggarensis TaxID=1470176 RepID=A0A221W458_9PSEU|nr:hypothetical protein [Actinoalloteichus hoggarensis]ASO20544.1 hypothetical protein AHOG_14510 [Actinoalloteichus hoggarensis]MBB5923584.1 hypothetical protein [Actinoalloteichus hoggarensis]
MSTTALTDRYVHEVVRRLPTGQRSDVAAELRATIADTVEARYPRTEDGERAVLAEMGDPIRLAARYADRPVALIGGELYPTYLRLLAVLLSTALPAAVAVLVALDVVDGGDLGSAVATGLGATFMIGIQLFGWTTVVFALYQRFRHDASRITRHWTPDDLPDFRKRDERATGSWASAVWSILLIGLIVWQHVARPYRADDPTGRIERVAVLDPALWSGWIWPILTGLAAVAVLELARIAARGWTMRLALGYAAAETVFALPLIWVLHDQRLFNEVFLTDINGRWETPDAFYTVTALGVLLISANAVYSRFRQARG